MSRRFQPHVLRHVETLDGVWDFAFLGDVDPDAVEVKEIRFTDRMAVPACFDATPSYAGRRGLVAYRRWIRVEAGRSLRLAFGSVHHWCRVVVDGKVLRDHAGGFTAFSATFTPDRSGDAELVMLVDNRFDARRAPLHLPYFDWYHYGGITRGVELHRLDMPWIERVTTTTESISPPALRVRIHWASSTAVGAVPFILQLDQRVILQETITLTSDAGVLERVVEVPDANLWSPSDPNLHLLTVQLGTDDFRVRIGLRQVQVADREILINGEPVRLLGVNRHTLHPEFGHALPEAVLITDVQQLQALGVNFVRGSHYPQDPRFLDLCDELGICVWSEAIGWQHGAEHLTNPDFIEAQLTHIDEMVTEAVNHPSVIMWGVLNESHSHDPACRPGYEALLNHLRVLDPSRPVTYACNHPFDDVCLDLVDIVSINCYPGWYEGEIDDIPEALDRIVSYLDTHGQAHKPLIISEIGAGAIYGWRDFNGARWTEQYQARLLETVIRHMFQAQDRFAGLAIWQFCDGRTPPEVPRILGRPRGFNNKGLVDEYRRPKLAFDVVSQAFHALRST